MSELGRGYRVKHILSLDLFSASYDIWNNFSFELFTRENTSCPVNSLNLRGKDQIKSPISQGSDYISIFNSLISGIDKIAKL